MANKFPSQNKLLYAHAAAVSNDGWTTLTTRNAADDGTLSGHLNLFKDLSILNRRGYHMTTPKGVPYVVRAKIDLFLQDEDGFGLNTAVGTDFMTTLQITGCQNNWVMRNAAVKFHAARDAMYKKAGIRKSDLGAYAATIRYNYDAADDSWVQPIDGDGNPLTGGTWDSTTISTEDDTDMQLRLVGSGIDEGSAVSATALQIGHSYLCSRAAVSADSNLESSTSPEAFSVLNDMLSSYPSFNAKDDVTVIARDEQDNPPYDSANDPGASLDMDITEPVELGRAIAGLGNAFGSVIVDIPFGLANLRMTHYDSNDTGVTSSPCMAIEVLDIYEMQG